MTSREARQRIDECELQVVHAYAGLKDQARNMGNVASQAASRATTLKTLLPLILCVLGLICIFRAWFLGLLMIAGGIFISYKLHGPAKEVQNRVNSMRQELNATIERTPSI